MRATPPPPRPPRLLLFLLALTAVAGCRTPGPRPPREAPAWTLLNTPHCRIRIESSLALPEAGIARIEEEAESAYAAIVADWGEPRWRPIPITIVAAGDRCHTDRNGMEIAASHLPRFDITHEMVHYVAGPSWRPVNEGLATWFTERLRHPPGEASWVPCDLYARAYAAAGLTVPLDSVSSEASMDFRAYMAAASFTKWLLETRGLAEFKRLYAGPRDGYARVYGKDRDTLIAEWKEALSAQTAWDADPRYVRLVDRLRRMQGARHPEPEERE